MAHMFISAAHKSSGKTTISIGLTALLARRGLDVAPCKKGPDYIDPIWLSLAANRSCANLDTFISSDEEVIEDFYAATENADISLIEGNKGLYDGVALDGSNSNAAVAKLLKAPVILVIDCRGMTRGIAPLLIGYQMFDADIRIAGVILNRVGGARHEAKLRASVEHFTTIPVLGAVHENPGLSIDEEHLGLIPGNELADAKDKINAIADFLAPALDLEKIIEIASSAERPAKTLTFKPDYKNYGQYAGLRIAIARDRAFGFYYPGDLQKFREYGAELVEFNALEDQCLPANIDGLFIGGGFPERHADRLSANQHLLTDIREKILAGLPAYAECGGLMVLCDSITWQNQKFPMASVIHADCTVHKKPQGRGYVKLQAGVSALWPDSAHQQNKIIKAHEFHYSKLDALPANAEFAYRVNRGTGIDGEHDGLIVNNLLASYTHMRHTNENPWVRNFLGFVALNRQKFTSGETRSHACHPAVNQ